MKKDEVAVDASVNEFFNSMLAKKHEYKIATKSKFSLSGIGKSRTIFELTSELKDVFLTPKKFSMLGEEYILGDAFVKALLYSPAHKEQHRAPKDIKPKDMVSPLAFQFAVEREQIAKQIFNELLQCWGLLEDWIERSHKKIEQYKNQIHELQAPVSRFSLQVKLPSYQKKIAELCGEKFFNSFTDLLKMQQQLQILIPKLKGSEEIKLDQDLSSSDEYAKLDITDIQSKDSVLKLIAEVKEFIKEANLLTNTVSSLLERSRTARSVVASDTSSLVATATKARQYLIHISTFIEQIKRLKIAQEWSFMEADWSLALEKNQAFIPDSASLKELTRLLADNQKRVIPHIQANLRMINAHLLADGGGTQETKSDSIIPSLTSTSDLELMTPAYLAESMSLQAMYEGNRAFFSQVILLVDAAIQMIEAMIAIVGDFSQMEILDGLTFKINEMGIKFKDLNRSSPLLSTIMKFFLYFKEFDEIRRGYESEETDIQEEKIENLSSRKMSIQQSSLQTLARKTHEEQISAQVASKKTSRLVLEKKARSLAKQYLSKDADGIFAFLREQKLIRPDYLSEAELKNQGKSETFVQSFERISTIMNASLEYFIRQFKRVNDYFGKAKGLVSLDTSQSFFASSTRMLVASKAVYQDADFILLHLSPAIRSEAEYWDSQKRAESALFVAVPNKDDFLKTTFSYDEIRKVYTIDKLRDMMEKAKTAGYYNPVLKLCIEYIAVERAFSKSLASLIIKCETALEVSGGKSVDDAKYSIEYKSLTKEVAEYHAVMVYLSDFLSKRLVEGTPQSPDLLNLLKFLEAKINPLNEFRDGLGKSKNLKEHNENWQKHYSDKYQKLTAEIDKDYQEIESKSTTMKGLIAALATTETPRVVAPTPSETFTAATTTTLSAPASAPAETAPLLTKVNAPLAFLSSITMAPVSSTTPQVAVVQPLVSNSGAEPVRDTSAAALPSTENPAVPSDIPPDAPPLDDEAPPPPPPMEVVQDRVASTAPNLSPVTLRKDEVSQSGGRDDLLAAIRSSGISSLRKINTVKSPEVKSAQESEMTLQQALVSKMQQRREGMRQDEEQKSNKSEPTSAPSALIQASQSGMTVTASSSSSSHEDWDDEDPDPLKQVLTK